MSTVVFETSGAKVLWVVLATLLSRASASSWDGRNAVVFDDYVPHQQYLMVIANQNVSEYSVDDPGGHRHLLMPIWAYQMAAGYLFFICVIGLILNTIVVIVLLNDPKKMTPLNWMLLNLACSDGIIAGFGAPISAAAAFHCGWPFSHELCVVYAMIVSTTGIASITTLSALAMLRCKLVVQKHVHPPNRISAFTNHSVRLQRHQAALLLTLIWSYSLAVTCPPLFGWGHYDREAGHISCSVNWELKVVNNRSYIFYVFAMGQLVPSVVVVVSYFSILHVVRKKTRRRDAAEKRSTVMVAVMIGAFIITWTPYSILALVEFFSDEQTVSPVWATVPCIFAKTAVVLNPIIYGFLNTQFRLTWEKFSIRFLGRPGRPYSGQLAATSSNEQPQTRQLADFSPAGRLTKILAQSINSSSKTRQNLSSPPCLVERQQQQEGEEKQESVLIDDPNQLPSPSLISPASEATATRLSNPCVGMVGDEQKEQPVSLEIVRYLPNADLHRIRMLHPLGMY
ncbi:pteropsin3 [Daphnia pulex]|uniref:Pteropsin3 n=1 Tax=Daphnia pulex TaxID=6669 RepID=E9G0T6_DAPPU|nr:pteropsin3 [Daphnia pulex]|eukprot:EFX87346.1 pteropsin3 [Daphnia pulex]